MTTKANLVKDVSKKTGMTKTKAESAVNAFLDALQDSLASSNVVRLINFGTFSVVKRKERNGRNPQTGKQITIPAQKVVKFKPGKNLKEEVK